MPWTCPACGSQIRHNPIEAPIRPSHRFRCHICRLELVVDERTNKMMPAPFDEPEAPAKPHRKP
jgi:transposase-like protein